MSDGPQSGNNSGWLRQILHAQRSGQTCLPRTLGLTPKQLETVAASYGLSDLVTMPCSTEAQERESLRLELLQMREEEWEQLRDLLLTHGRGNNPATEAAFAALIAAGCLGGDHLWRDLGLASRADLKALLIYNFPDLAARNIQNMRWKKFFYKQLCEQDDAYVCRAPTCEQCPTHQDCFGNED